MASGHACLGQGLAQHTFYYSPKITKGCFHSTGRGATEFIYDSTVMQVKKTEEYNQTLDY